MRSRSLAPMAVGNTVTWIATTIYGFAVVALIVRVAGKSDFGVWATVGAFRSFVIFLDGGLAASVTRDVALGTGRDADSGRRVLAAWRIYALLGAITLALGFAGARLPGLLLGLEGEIVETARIVTILIAVETALALAGGPLPAALRGSQRFDLLAMTTVLQTVLGVILLFIFVEKWGLMGAAWASLIARAVFLVANLVAVRALGLMPSGGNGDARSATSATFRFALPIWLGAAGAQLGLMTDVPIVGAIYGAETASEFALGARLPFTAAALLFAILAAAFPRMVKADQRERRLLAGGMIYLACLLAGSGFGFLALNAGSLLEVWVGTAPALSVRVMLIYAIAWALNAPAHVLASLAMAKGRHHVLAKVVMVETPINLAISIVLALLWTATGPALASLAVIFVSNIIVVPLLMVRRLDLSLGIVVRPALTGYLLGIGIAAVAVLPGMIFGGGPVVLVVLGAVATIGLAGAAVDLTAMGHSVLRKMWILTRRSGWSVLARHRRESREHEAKPLVWTSDSPLVTVRIATYNRGKLVAERAIASALAQTYENIEVLVVGDHCDEATAEAVLSVKDPRVRFVNLPERGRYPEDPRLRWMVAGEAPMNHALEIARGEWIAPLDDDDEFTPDHVEVLLSACRSSDLEFAYGIARMEYADGTWSECGAWPLRKGHIVHAAVLYSLRLKNIRHDIDCWRIDQPGDWNLWTRFRRAGVRMGFVDQVVCKHYEEAREFELRPRIWQ